MPSARSHSGAAAPRSAKLAASKSPPDRHWEEAQKQFRKSRTNKEVLVTQGGLNDVKAALLDEFKAILAKNVEGPPTGHEDFSGFSDEEDDHGTEAPTFSAKARTPKENEGRARGSLLDAPGIFERGCW